MFALSLQPHSGPKPRIILHCSTYKLGDTYWRAAEFLRIGKNWPAANLMLEMSLDKSSFSAT
jgi:hypothetical protein